MKRTVLLLASVALAVLLASGTALAQALIPPDLSISYHGAPDKVQPGSTSNYSYVSVKNRGGSSVTIPSGTVLTRHTLDGGAFGSYCYAPTGHSCNKTGDRTIEVVSQGSNTVGAGATMYVEYYITAPNTAGKMSTSVVIDPNEAISEADETNNTSTKTIYVGDPPPTDLSVTQADSEDPVRVGSSVYYEVVVTNNGADTAFNVQVQDDLPENATYEYAYAYGSCSHFPDYGAVLCPMGNIPSGESETMELEVTATALGTISNTATASSDYGDTDTSNNSATEDTVVQDTRRPSGTVLINGGKLRTASRAVTLRLDASDPTPSSGVASMRLQNAGGTWTAWQPHAESKGWKLTRGAGKKTVYVQYRDAAGNVSAKASDSITYRP